MPVTAEVDLLVAGAGPARVSAAVSGGAKPGDRLMERHKANHLNVVLAPDADDAYRALVAKAPQFDVLRVAVHHCGDVTAEGRRPCGTWA